MCALYVATQRISDVGNLKSFAHALLVVDVTV